jgi:endonuclease/exonuclease/phosphatase family metal-dependent hydrolase
LLTLWSAAQVARRRRAALVTTALAATLFLAAVPAARPAEPERQITVMTFNVWYGGAQIDETRTARAIRRSGADIVGLQEPEGNVPRIARMSGLPYYDESLHVISRWPLFSVRRGGVRLDYAALDLDSVVAIGNLHLTSTPYGPEAVRDGKGPQKVLALERSTRLPEIRPWLRPLARLGASGTPTFLTGDFNSPSHLDWTAATAAAFPERVKFPLAWPVSSALARFGIRDSYREAHPDPIAWPGLTWTAGTPPPRIRRIETVDRIDWVMATGPATTLASRLVGEAGGPSVELGVSPWPSDHRAVASTFSVTPGRAPALVSAFPRVVTRGDRVTLRYTRMKPNGRKVAILGPDSDRPLMSLPIYDASDHIAPLLGTRPLRPGAYRAGLLDRSGRVLAASPFWIEAPGTRPAIRAARTTFRRGDPIELRYRGAPANKYDWVGIYPAGEPDVYNYLGFLYTGARPSGSITFTESDLGKLAPGRYRATLMLDDGYSVLARTTFRVR